MLLLPVQAQNPTAKSQQVLLLKGVLGSGKLSLGLGKICVH